MLVFRVSSVWELEDGHVLLTAFYCNECNLVLLATCVCRFETLQVRHIIAIYPYCGTLN